MGTFLAYNLKISACLILFYFLYKLLLSRHSFYRINRITLLCGYLMVLFIPLIGIKTSQPMKIHSIISEYEQVFTVPAVTDITIIPNDDINKQASLTSAPLAKTEVDWIQIILYTYILGTAFFSFRMLYSLFSIFKLIHGGRKIHLENATLIIHKKDKAPFSWMKYILISESEYIENNQPILKHELAHIQARHSTDVLIAEIFSIFQWYNPAIWLIKKELQDIHEYEADNSVLNSGIDAKQYQLLLIKKAVGPQRFNSMVNSFNHSKLKKRITMMLKEKSTPWARLKYLMILPLVAVSVLAFARPEISNNVEKISNAEVSKITSIMENNQNSIKSQVIGRWKLVGGNTFRAGSGTEQIKIITEDSFTWFRYDSSGDIITGASGSYTVTGTTYTEDIKFAMEGMGAWKGKKAVYEVKMEGNKMITSGLLDGRIEVNEEWERVK